MPPTFSYSLAAVLGSALTFGLAAANVRSDSGPALRHHAGPSAAHLPRPYATPSANNQPRIVPRPNGAELRVPNGFRVARYASGFQHPRSIVVAPNGDVFVTEPLIGHIVLLRGAERPSLRTTFATGLNEPFGMAFYPPGSDPKYLYVANTDSIVRYAYRNGQTRASAPPEKIGSLPGYGYRQHWTRNLVVDPKRDKLYVSVGSRENVGVEPPPRACILEMNPDGSGRKVYASGLRNAVGIAINPATGALWADVNERDDLGDGLVPDFVTSVRPGGFYGWPYYYIGGRHDPRMPQRPDLRARVLTPDLLLESHVAPLEMAFYTGTMFPSEFRGDAFVALHGSWNRSERVGYEVIRIPFANGRPKGGYDDFVVGWMLDSRRRSVWGRPVGIAVAKDGALLIVDDAGRAIWRVSYRGP